MSVVAWLVRCRPRRAATAALAVVALAVSGETAFAQGGGGGGGGGGGARMQAALFKGITLTDAERAKVDSIRAAYQANAGGATSGQDMSPDDRQKRRLAMRQQMMDYRTVLTPDQQTQFDQNVAAMRSRGGGAGGGARDTTASGPPQ
jgi:Spy/CpxP family protein refolding chaperone